MIKGRINMNFSSDGGLKTTQKYSSLFYNISKNNIEVFFYLQVLEWASSFDSLKEWDGGGGGGGYQRCRRWGDLLL